MKRKFVVVGVIALLSIFTVFTLAGCDITTGGYHGPEIHELSVDNLDDLKTIYGNDTLFPSDGSVMSDIKVHTFAMCCGVGNLIDYQGKVEYIEQLSYATWNYYASNGVTINVRVEKYSQIVPTELLVSLEKYVILENIDVTIAKNNGLILGTINHGENNVSFYTGDRAKNATCTVAQQSAYILAVKEYAALLVKEPINTDSLTIV